MLSTEQRGLFLVLYGPNNIGKSAAINGAQRGLKQMGLPVEFVKYPIYDLAPTGPWLNRFLREGNPENATQLDAQRKFADNRRDYEPYLRKILIEGKCVVAEDYVGTGLAWGQTWGIEPMVLREINQGLLDPDLAILLWGERFKTGIEKNHKNEQAGDEMWQRNQQIHLQLAEEFGWRKVSNHGKTIEQVSEEVSTLVKDFITRNGKKI